MNWFVALCGQALLAWICVDVLLHLLGWEIPPIALPEDLRRGARQEDEDAG